LLDTNKKPLGTERLFIYSYKGNGTIPPKLINIISLLLNKLESMLYNPPAHEVGVRAGNFFYPPTIKGLITMVG
jgi:hypothetical protein